MKTPRASEPSTLCLVCASHHQAVYFRALTAEYYADSDATYGIGITSLSYIYIYIYISSNLDRILPIFHSSHLCLRQHLSSCVPERRSVPAQQSRPSTLSTSRQIMFLSSMYISISCIWCFILAYTLANVFKLH